MIRAAAVLCWFNAIGFGVFTIPAMARVQAGKDLPIPPLLALARTALILAAWSKLD